MRSRLKILLVAASAMASSAGCWEPQEIIPVAPPGFEMTRVPTTPQGEGAQALGEQSAASLATSNQPKEKPVPRIVANSPPTALGKPTTDPSGSGLVYETLVEGTGPIAKSGDSVLMHYTGTLEDGTKFDSSLDKGQPLPVTLGMGGVIQGWDEGIPGMRVGEKRKLIIPAHLAYKDKRMGKIPPNSTLTFEVELVKIQ